MTLTANKLALYLTVLLPVAGLSQGFGNFRADQPFLAASASASAEIQPDAVSGLVTWLKADVDVYNDNGTTLATNGQTVLLWKDKSANGWHFAQDTAGTRPTFNTNQINGKPAVAFNSKWMTNGAVNIAEPHTVMIVYKLVGQNDPGYLIGGGNYGVASFSIWGSDAQYAMYWGDTSGTTAHLGKGVGTTTAWNYVTIGANDSSSWARTNGVYYTFNYTGVSSRTIARMRIGNNSYLDQAANFQIAELIIYNSIIATNSVVGVELYLKNKYGL